MSSQLGARPVAPRHRSRPQAVLGRQAADEAVELAALAGLHLDAWQSEFLQDALAVRADGRWAAREAALVCPRQNGKGAVLEAVELAGLFLFDEQLILHSAHEFKTASEAFRRVWSLIESTPDLERQVHRKLANNNDMSVELRSGQRLRFVARTGGSGRGFSGDRVILDEAYNLPEQAISALVFTTAARDNPQVWYTSSAPLPSESSAVLRRICKRGRGGDPSLVYAEFKAEDDVDLADEEAWQEANPGYPFRITDEAIRLELGVSLPVDFARERLGIWPDETEAHRVVQAADWSACATPTYEPGPLSFAVDVSPDGASAAVGVSDGTLLEVVAHRAGTAWVVPECVARRDLFQEVTLDPAGPAGVLVAPLTAAGITVREVTIREHVAACGQLLNAITDGAVRHLAQPELDAAVAAADRRDVGDGGWLWSRRRSTVDICTLVAVGLARWTAAATVPTPEPGFVDLSDFDEE